MARPNERHLQNPGLRGGGRSSPRAAGALPTPNHIEYFVDGDGGRPNPALIAGSEELAKQISGMPPSQLRRFYGEVASIARQDEMSAEAILTHMALMKAKVAYTLGRRTKEDDFPDAFVQFVFDHAASVQNWTGFQEFRRIFEAVVAFHRFYGKNE